MLLHDSLSCATNMAGGVQGWYTHLFWTVMLDLMRCWKRLGCGPVVLSDWNSNKLGEAGNTHHDITKLNMV